MIVRVMVAMFGSTASSNSGLWGLGTSGMASRSIGAPMRDVTAQAFEQSAQGLGFAVYIAHDVDPVMQERPDQR